VRDALLSAVSFRRTARRMGLGVLDNDLHPLRLIQSRKEASTAPCKRPPSQVYDVARRCAITPRSRCCI
jgi:hypothetical protein